MGCSVITGSSACADDDDREFGYAAPSTLLQPAAPCSAKFRAGHRTGWETHYAFQAHDDNPDRHGAGYSRWLCVPHPLARSQDREEHRRLHFAAHRHLPSPDQDDHCAARVLDPRRGRGAYGRYQSGGPHRREGHGLVHRGFPGLAPPGNGSRQCAATRRQSQFAAARCGGRNQSQGHLAIDEGVCRASRAALDRRGDGDQRDSSRLWCSRCSSGWRVPL